METSWRIIGLIAELNTFSLEPVGKWGNETLNFTYLSKTVNEELIVIMGNNGQDAIVNQINSIETQ